MADNHKKPIGFYSNTTQTFTPPPVIFGTSGLGNLYVALSEEVKQEIVKEFIIHSGKPAFFDSAGKYGAGLALESLGKALRSLKVSPEEVMISNKLGWLRTELKTPEPTFEPGVWRNLEHDAVQKISYDGILECFEQGNHLLHGYVPQYVSVHDPDEYLAKAGNQQEYEKLYNDIIGGYKALEELKEQGKVMAIGVGAKDWKVIQKISKDISLDWVMIANSMTLISHPKDLLEFMIELKTKNVQIINSAVFNGGFLVGGDYYNYKSVRENTPENEVLLNWRDRFFALCSQHKLDPAVACVQFGFHLPGVVSIAVSTTKPQNVKQNIDMVQKTLPEDFWKALKNEGLIEKDFPTPDMKGR